MAFLVPSSTGFVAASFQWLVAWLAPWPQMVVASTEVASRAIGSEAMLLWCCPLGVLKPNPHHNNKISEGILNAV
jgi:hypothetical protein